ncbi:DUF1764-domain-containing protein [Rhizopogon salebrosus TDB-379]|nr:DUF1764-domain-containing protein [Rhizopogon salebrosus TDB-379]
MPTSEIDDIFSAKGKAKVVESLAPIPSVNEKKKKRKKKDKLSASDNTKEINPSSESKTQKKRPAPETVVDPSSKSSSSIKRPKLDVSAPSQHVKAPHEKRKEDVDRFKDSRGSGSRQKTDDGYNIYKEDELGISNTGGDTPLCPFDCDCCMC